LGQKTIFKDDIKILSILKILIFTLNINSLS